MEMIVKEGSDYRSILDTAELDTTEILKDKNACVEFIEKLKNIDKDKVTTEQIKNDPEIRAKVINALNNVSCAKLEPDASFGDIAYCWQNEYVRGGGLTLNSLFTRKKKLQKLLIWAIENTEATKPSIHSISNLKF